MKTNTIARLCCLLLFLFGLAGCGGEEENAAAGVEPADEFVDDSAIVDETEPTRRPTQTNEDLLSSGTEAPDDSLFGQDATQSPDEIFGSGESDDLGG